VAPIKAITFDLWNTLLVEKSFTKKRIEILSEAIESEGKHVDAAKIETAYRAVQRRHDDLWSREYCHYPLAERLDYVIEETGASLVPASKEWVIERYSEIIHEDPPALTEGAVETVSRLAPRFRLGIISDTGVTSGSQIRRLLGRFGMLHHFTATVFSDETLLCKPRREAFEAALRGLKVKPAEALHVGDLLRTDVAGAKAAGWKGVWLKVRDPDAKGVVPDYTITRLAELLEIPEIMGRF
jgi:putative hydrolase of the HAD superfamily